MSATPIQHVSDTAYWVAAYRALETARPDALFRDPLAERLAGRLGHEIAGSMVNTRFTCWAIVMRTCIIDSFIQKVIAGGVDTVLNLGAGLDTRPYRLALPSSVRWIEVDYPRILEYKESLLAAEKPLFNLERVALDLAEVSDRRKLFSRVNAESSRVLVLTEGVVPYLSEEQTSSLAHDLAAQDRFQYWVLDYLSRAAIAYLARGKMREQMKNAPFQFNPKDWAGFFEKSGWELREMRYLAYEGEKLKRPIPMAWWMKLMTLVMSPKNLERFRRSSGYALLQRPEGG